MTPPQIIIMIGLGAFVWSLIEYLGIFTPEPCTLYDSPKDLEFYLIGDKLEETEQEPNQNSLLTSYTKETNTFEWEVKYKDNER